MKTNNEIMRRPSLKAAAIQADDVDINILIVSIVKSQCRMVAGRRWCPTVS